ncbi:hypothetical protein MRX96_053953, partial [Rhipicephalus microplus]
RSLARLYVDFLLVLVRELDMLVQMIAEIDTHGNHVEEDALVHLTTRTELF